MRTLGIILCLCGLLPLCLQAQQERRYIRQGNELYQNKQYKEAEEKYAEALKLKKDYLAAYINQGSALYQLDSLEAAAQLFELAANLTTDKNLKAQAYHNLGNAYFKAGKYEESVAAYKNALRNNPNDADTRYNLTYAQGMIKKQPPEEQKKDQENQDKENDKNQDKKSGQSQDPQKNDQQKDAPGQKNDKPNDPKQGNKGNPEDAEKPKDPQKDEKNIQPKPGKMSKADLEKLLEALKNEELKVQERVQIKEQPPGEVIPIEKDW